MSQVTELLPVIRAPGAGCPSAAELVVRRTWLWSWWVPVSFATPVVAALVLTLLGGTTPRFLVGQTALATSAFVSLGILSARPLLNPVQAGVLAFYWWFAIGPLAMAAHALATGRPADAEFVQRTVDQSSWVVVAGLPLYALAGREALGRLQRRNLGVAFLLPSGMVYEARTLMTWWAVSWGAAGAVHLLALAGFGGTTTVNFLGGTRTEFWLAGVLLAVSRISVLATSALMFHLAVTRWQSPWWLLLISAFVVAQTFVSAITGGWKGAFVVLLAMFMAARVSLTQRPPWLLAMLGALLFLAIVEPFVSAGRGLARMAGAESVEERRQAYSQLLTEGGGLDRMDGWQTWKVEIPFRGIATLSGEVMATSSWFSGPWQGETIIAGMLAGVPRAIYPDKPDMNVGNYFARNVKVPAVGGDPDDYLNSVALSIPFEVVGNYGWIAGVLAFGLLGGAWALWCGWILTPARVASHPLAPLFVLGSLAFEQPVGAFLASQRDLLFVLGIALFTWGLRGRRA